MPRTPEELKQALREQRRAIRSSCIAFDSGERWEARRIATAIVNLLYDRGRTQSLLTQMGVKTSTRFLSTSAPNPPGNILTWTPLLVMTIGMGTAYRPRFGEGQNRQRLLAFDDWWNESVYEDGEMKLTRSVLLRTLRDQDGGSHYDPEVSDQAYKLMKQGAGWFSVTPDGTFPMEDAELTTVRQIAYEIEFSLDAAGIT